MGGKLDKRWDGPYIVEAKLSKGRYQLRSSSGVVLKKLYSSCLLKEYYDTGTDQYCCKYELEHCECVCVRASIHIYYTWPM